MNNETIIALASILVSGSVSIFTIVLNYRTARFNAEANERIKRLELRNPIIYEALGELTASFTKLKHIHDETSSDHTDPYYLAEEFSASAYRLASFIHDADIQNDLYAMATGNVGGFGIVNDSELKQFDALLIKISIYLS